MHRHSIRFSVPVLAVVLGLVGCEPGPAAPAVDAGADASDLGRSEVALAMGFDDDRQECFEGCQATYQGCMEFTEWAVVHAGGDERRMTIDCMDDLYDCEYGCDRDGRPEFDPGQPYQSTSIFGGVLLSR